MERQGEMCIIDGEFFFFLYFILDLQFTFYPYIKV